MLGREGKSGAMDDVVSAVVVPVVEVGDVAVVEVELAGTPEDVVEVVARGDPSME